MGCVSMEDGLKLVEEMEVYSFIYKMLGVGGQILSSVLMSPTM